MWRRWSARALHPHLATSQGRPKRSAIETWGTAFKPQSRGRCLALETAPGCICSCQGPDISSEPPAPYTLHPGAGFSGAELANVVNEAALLAGRRGMEAVALPELLEGVQRTKCAPA